MKYNDPIKYNNQYVGYYGDILDAEVEYIDYSNYSSVEYSTFSSSSSETITFTEKLDPESQGEISFDQTSSDSESQISIKY
jgi:hypothetical protein